VSTPAWAGRTWGGPIDWAPPLEPAPGKPTEVAALPETSPEAEAAAEPAAEPVPEPVAAAAPEPAPATAEATPPQPAPAPAEATAEATTEATAPGLCLAGEAASSWLTLRAGPSALSEEKARLTTADGPLHPSGPQRSRRTQLWVAVTSARGEGWVRARFLGPCAGQELPPLGAAEVFEVDRLLGRVARAISASEAGELAAALPEGGTALLGPAGAPALEAEDLLARLKDESALSGDLAAGAWEAGEAETLEGIGEALPLRHRYSGATLWFARVEGRPALVAIGPAPGPAASPE
jgi:hypothetical protein